MSSAARRNGRLSRYPFRMCLTRGHPCPRVDGRLCSCYGICSRDICVELCSLVIRDWRISIGKRAMEVEERSRDFSRPRRVVLHLLSVSKRRDRDSRTYRILPIHRRKMLPLVLSHLCGRPRRAQVSPSRAVSAARKDRVSSDWSRH